MFDRSVIEAEFGDIGRYAECPPFWVAMPDAGMAFLDTCRAATVRTIGRSAGDRAIIAVEYGQKEPLDATTANLASAIAAGIGKPDPTEIFPASFFGSRRRRQPALCIQGGIHGGELTGTVAALNLCRIIETGQDLRGREWPQLCELARATRITIIPWLNIDGNERWLLPNPSGVPIELYSRCLQGVAKDGTKYTYPKVKHIFPIPPDQTAFMGSYYNDAGVNLQYDFCMPRRQPETVAWMDYYLDERPDAVLIAHCNGGSLIGPPEPYLPEGYQHELSRLGGAVRQRLLHDGFPVGRMSWAGLVGLGKPFMNQMNAVYHVCGTMPVMCEFPAGADIAPYTPEQMLDIGLITLEEILFYAHHDGLRPYEVWEKVRQKLPA